MARSLTSRFILASLLLLPLVLGISAYSLDLAFRQSLLSGEREHLKSHIYLLLAAAEVTEDQLWMPDSFQEPRFDQLDSGLYGIVSGRKGEERWRSRSAQWLELSGLEFFEQPIAPGTTRFTTLSPGDEPLFAFSQDVAWELADGSVQLLRFTVLHGRDEFAAALGAYRQQLWRWLGLLAVSILVVQALILRWGLRPLRTLARDLKQIENGTSEQLSGDYPREIQPVTDNLNHVVASERQQRERYRTTMDDLAHSLKTPLAVIQSAASDDAGPAATTVREQVERMDQIVHHQLKRAAVQYRHPWGRQVRLQPIVERLLTSLQKVYADKNIIVERQLPEDLSYGGDERDLFELLGNLLDNAFKYGRRKVRVEAHSDEGDMHLVIGDDGPGVPKHQQAVILDRGARADTAAPGQGIGLAVTIDIVSSYGGSLAISHSPLGGARFTVSLPTRAQGRQDSGGRP